MGQVMPHLAIEKGVIERINHMTLREYIRTHRVVTDGAMGTYYASQKEDQQVSSEMANITEPELVKKIHQEYIEAGATMLRTNTFTANIFSLHTHKELRDQVVKEGVRLAREVAKGAKHKVYIAGSIGPIPQHYGVEEDSLLEEYKAIIDRLLSEQVDVILFETFSDFYYIESLIPYIREQSDCFIMANFSVNKNGYTMSGISAKRLCGQAENLDGLDGFGFNCGIGSGHMLTLLDNVILPKNKYVAIMPNAGYPEQMQNRMVFRENSQYFFENMQKISRMGISFLGGCCGTTPKHIAIMVQKLQGESISITEITKLQESVRQKQSEPKENEFYQLFSTDKKVVAVELDPPYNADYELLVEYTRRLQAGGCDIITMADSPMGRSRVDSILMSIKLRQETGMRVMPHVCCRDKNMIAMRSSLLGAYINDIRNLLVVTGDPVPGESRINTTSVFDYNSIRLMKYIKEMNEEHFNTDPFCYGGALNYARGNIDKVVERMQRKIDAGAKYFLSQPVYAKEDIERLYEIKQRVDTKLLCGIMPFVSYRNANFIKNEFYGITVPDSIVSRYHEEMAREEAELVGADIANEIVEQLKDFADGYYFMLPFNRVSLMDHIIIQ